MPQPVDVRVDRVLVAVVLVAPDLVEQVQPRVTPCRDGGQRSTAGRIRAASGRSACLHLHLARHRIDAQARRDRGGRPPAARCGPSHRCGAAGPHARHQFQHREGLGQVVVGAELQPEDAVHLAGARAGDDDRRVARHRARRRQISRPSTPGSIGRAPAHPMLRVRAPHRRPAPSGVCSMASPRPAGACASVRRCGRRLRRSGRVWRDP